ncbi:fibronectin type III domain-containing protein [Roseivirga sp. BDSF3-8]|uniref:fibronectin type III domain-containing protein n=1 Tax=Roseivirga sp. BDSF3-8 TaxID=3241598 RepID=UPI00353266EF
MKLKFYSILLAMLVVLQAQAQTTLLNEGFGSGLGVMTPYNATGAQVWTTANYGSPAPCGYMTGYSGTQNTNEDWLISPPLDFSDMAEVSLSFIEAINYESNVSANCQILISTTYSGSGDPANASWSTVNMPARSAGNSWSFVASGDADLSSYAGQTGVYVALRYLSTTTSAGTWEIDNLAVTGTSLTAAASPAISSISRSPSGNVTASDNVSISATITDDVSVSSATLLWGTSSSNLNNSLSMSNGPQSSYSATIPAQPNGTTVFYQVSATDGDSNTTTSAMQSYAVKADVFDVVTYNIEWLGAPGKAGLSMSRDEQLTAAAQDILDASADIYALQEIVIDDVNGDALADLLTKLNSMDNSDSWAGGYNQYFSYWWNPDFANFPAQRQAFVYRTSTVSNVSFTTLLTDVVLSGDSRFGSGRLPFMMTATVTIDGSSSAVRLVDLHLKCCTGGATRRLESMQTLVAELNATYSNDNMIVLGDLNVADNGGATGEISTWGVYDDLDNDTEADYFHAAGAKTDQSFYDIDHILLSNELADEFAAAPANVQNKQLPTRVSDHFPILTSMVLNGGTVTPDTEAPAVPSGLSAANVTAGGFTLSWNASTDNVGVTGYDVYQNGSLIGSAASTSYNVSGLNASTTYLYKVAAKDAAGNVSAQSPQLSVTTASAPVADTQAPTTPAGLTVSNVTSTDFTLGWTASTDNVGVTGYDVFQNGVLIGSTAATSYNVTGLSASTTYLYKVAAKDAAGNVSAQSSQVSVTTQAAPAGPSVIISEYIEGSSYNKAIEITNLGTSSIDLANYTIKRQVNGAGAWDNGLTLSGTLAAGGVYVIVNNQAKKQMKRVANLTTSDATMSFNGNDPVGLFENGVLIDIVGTYNGGSGNFAQDVTLVRNGSVTGGNVTYTTTEWAVFTTDTFNDLGKHTYSTARFSAPEETFSAATFSAYPNPVMASEALTVVSEVASEVTITLYDVNGRVQFAVPATGSRTELSLNGLRPGVYMLSVQDADTVKTERIIVR